MNANDIWLIAGLGNPEAKYEGTRHNAGFAALDSLAGKWGISVSKTKFQGLWGQGEVDGHKVVLLKPLTYMNLSGDSIAPLAGFFKIPADHVIVLCDDITQAPGKLRIRPSGSAGGHNGLKSIIARLGGENFPRIRIGVGAKPRPDYDLADWVLGKFPAEDAKALADRWPDLEAAAKLAQEGIEAEVLDLRTLVPLDWDAIVKTVSKTHNAIIVSEEVKRGSFAGELSAQIGEELFDELDAPVERVCGLNICSPFSPVLEDKNFPHPEDIVAAVKRVLNK